jgi:hypothetical protein
MRLKKIRAQRSLSLLRALESFGAGGVNPISGDVVLR